MTVTFDLVTGDDVTVQERHSGGGIGCSSGACHLLKTQILSRGVQWVRLLQPLMTKTSCFSLWFMSLQKRHRREIEHRYHKTDWDQVVSWWQYMYSAQQQDFDLALNEYLHLDSVIQYWYNMCRNERVVRSLCKGQAKRFVIYLFVFNNWMYLSAFHKTVQNTSKFSNKFE